MGRTFPKVFHWTLGETNTDIECPGDDGRPFTLSSLGQDGQLGGSDDAADIVYIE